MKEGGTSASSSVKVFPPIKYRIERILRIIDGVIIIILDISILEMRVSLLRKG